MSSVLRSIAQPGRNSAMAQNDLSSLSTYTVTDADAQNQLYYNAVSSIQITLPSRTTAKWAGYPLIYITNMSSSRNTQMTFNFSSPVKVKAPDQDNYVHTFSVRGGFNGYLIYVGNDQWMLQGVGANFDCN